MPSIQTDEEEKQDTVVRLEDIMKDVYSLKFRGNNQNKDLSKKRTFEDSS
jgi:hypothetical protein